MNMANQLREKLGVDAPVKKDFNIQYGFNESSIIVIFGAQIDNLHMNLEQCDDMIRTLQEVRTMFVEKKNG